MAPALMPDAVAQACYTVDQLAVLLNISVRHAWRLSDAGKLPAAVRLGKSVRWPRVSIEAWIAAGCPAQSGR